MAAQPSTPATLAAIDIGSNSFRLELAQVLRGRYRRLQYLKRTVRLGADLDDEGRLREAGIIRGLDCLAEFARRLDGLAPAQVRAVATQTLREAANRDEFLARAQATLGYPIEVISGREEARLIFAGVSHLQPSPERRLVIDIGGRSTEIILGQGRQPLAAESFPVGSVGLSLRYFADGRLSPQAFRAAEVAAGAEFEEALDVFDRTHWREALGSSGTVGAVSQILAASGITDGRITAPALARLIELAIQAGTVQRIELAGLKEDRRAVLPGGLAILYTLLVHLGIDELLPAKGALRQGVIIELHDRLAPVRGRAADVREDTVAGLQQRFGVDTAQARRVQAVALALHDAVASPDDAQTHHELAWACALHEIGMAVSHHDHHRHSAYLLAHLDAPGFSQNQQRRLADLALAQRGGLRKSEALLRDPASAWAVLCLRLAVIRCHARRDDGGPLWVLSRHGAQTAALAWQPAHQAPDLRTLHLLQQEAQAWARHTGLRLTLPPGG